MIAATAGTDCAPIVRIAKCDDDHVKRVLDLGAEGICFPLIKTAQEAEWAVKSLRYPPDGTRSFSPFLAQSRYQTDLLGYAAEFEKRAICFILAETPEAVENIDEICAVEGIDMIIPAPFDLSCALGIPGQFDNPDFKAAVAKIEAAAISAGVPLGGVALAKEQADALFARGYRAVVGFDILWLRSVGAEMAGWCS